MKKNFNIEFLIKERLKLPTIKRNFYNSYGILEPTLDKFKWGRFLKQYINWTPEKQKEFLIELGGPINITYTRKLFENLTKELITKDSENEETARV